MPVRLRSGLCEEAHDPRGVQCDFKNRAVIFPVGPEFQSLPIDGYTLSLSPGAIGKLIKFRIEGFFVINNDF